MKFVLLLLVVSPYELEYARAYGAGAVALTPPEVTAPVPAPDDPSPTPNPSGDCPRCEGRGTMDGRIPCPECGGSGKITLADAIAALKQKYQEAPILQREQPPPLNDKLIALMEQTIANHQKIFGNLDSPEIKEVMKNLAEYRNKYSKTTLQDQPIELLVANDRMEAKILAKITRKPVFIYWTALVDCPPCREFEKEILDNPQVQKVLSTMIFTKIVVDPNKQEDIDLIRQEGFNSVPKIMIINPDWTEKKVFSPIPRDPVEFMRELQELNTWASQKVSLGLKSKYFDDEVTPIRKQSQGSHGGTVILIPQR